MGISETHLTGLGYDIRLPLFGQDAPDRFYGRMAEEMIAYVSSNESVRRYSSVFYISEEDETVKITVEIHARLFDESRGISRRKKALRQSWKNGSLTSLSEDKIM